MKRKLVFAGIASAFTIAGLLSFKVLQNKAADNAGLTLPQGFKAITIAENIGRARHIAVTPQNDIYVHLAGLQNGKGIIVLHDNGTGKADVKASFGNFGGTGITIHDGYLYASSNTTVYRYKLNANNEVTSPDKPEIVVSGMVAKRTHQDKSMAFDNAGNMYVNIGAYSNICSELDPDKKGCPILDSAGGVWRFKADKLNQKQGDGIRFATGLRNIVGMDWNQQANQLFVMQHGRDLLNPLFPKLYTVKQSAELPSEVMFALKEGDNGGWPYVYFDHEKKKNMLGPEYGGDGQKEADPKYLKPVAGYPGHLAPVGLMFYTGNQFPAKYKNGAFIAFHGSWNRAPEPQDGFFVVFQPFKNGRPDGQWEIFANGFAGTAEQKAAGRAEHRPVGLGQASDGSIYVSDDNKGFIYKISYQK